MGVSILNHPCFGYPHFRKPPSYNPISHPLCPAGLLSLLQGGRSFAETSESRSAELRCSMLALQAQLPGSRSKSLPLNSTFAWYVFVQLFIRIHYIDSVCAAFWNYNLPFCIICAAFWNFNLFHVAWSTQHLELEL